jgi:hypothetical protein
MKDHIYLPSGSDYPDWYNDDITSPSPNAMESARLYILQVSKIWRLDLPSKSQFIQTILFYGEKFPLSGISQASTLLPCTSNTEASPSMTSKVARPLKRSQCSIYGSLIEDKRREKHAHRDIRGHSSGFSKPSSSDPPQIA